MADSLLAARTLLDTDRLIRGRVTSVLKIPRIADRIGVRRKRRAAVALGGAARVNPDD